MSNLANNGANIKNIAPELVKAIIEVKDGLGTLAKSEKNPFHKYNYVSIDKYYEHVAHLAAKSGLSWRCNMTDVSVFSEGTDDRGRSTNIMRFEFCFDLFHTSGNYLENWQTFVILHPIQGAQTSGAATSYAEKLFMRTTFSVVTAEDDVDAKSSTFNVEAKSNPPRRRTLSPLAETPTNENSTKETSSVEIPSDWKNMEDIAALVKPRMLVGVNTENTPPTPIATSDPSILEKDADSIMTIMDAFISMCNDVPTLTKFYTENKPALITLKNINPDRHAELLLKFKERKSVLEGQNNG